METKPIELNVNLKREPFIKLYFDTSADYYDTFMWRKWSSTIIMAAIVIITTAVVMMTATLSKEKVIRFLAMVANSIPSMEKIQIIPVTIGTIMACFVAGIIFLKFCKYQWGDGFTMKFILNPFSPQNKDGKSWCWLSLGDYKDWRPPANISHRFMEKDIDKRSEYYVYNGRYQLRTKFVVIGVVVSVVGGFMLWIGWIYTMILCL